MKSSHLVPLKIFIKVSRLKPWKMLIFHCDLGPVKYITFFIETQDYFTALFKFI